MRAQDKLYWASHASIWEIKSISHCSDISFLEQMDVGETSDLNVFMKRKKKELMVCKKSLIIWMDIKHEKL